MSKEPLVKGAPVGITDGSERGFAVGNGRCVSRVMLTRLATSQSAIASTGG